MKYTDFIRAGVALSALTGLTLTPFSPLSPLSLPSVAAPPAAKTAPPQAQVESFLTYHVSHEPGLTTKSLEARKRWLAPSLYRLLQREIERQTAFEAKHPNEAPFMDGDVFLASQEVPTGIKAAPAPIRGAVCDVPVTLRFGPGSRKLIYRMRRTTTPPPARWLVEDVISEGESLQTTLRRPVYDTLPTPAPKRKG